MVNFYNSVLLQAVPTPLLLDTFSGAVVAYSLRKIRNLYSGKCVRVRRSSDNTQQDIGFVAGVLDTVTLLSFCGAGNGFVVTWYDQSSNGVDVTQATTGNQPQIVTSGALYSKGTNSKPAVYWGGAQFLQSAANIGISGNPAHTISAVTTSESTSGYGTLGFYGVGGGGTCRLYPGRNTGNGNAIIFAGYGGLQPGSIYNLAANTVLKSQIWAHTAASSAVGACYQNGSSASLTSVGAGTPNLTNSQLNLGRDDTNVYFGGYTSEYIWWPSELSSGNVTTVYNNQSTYFGL